MEVSNSNNCRHHVMVTGTTGALGSSILSSLLEDLDVVRIYCLNRARDGKSAQIQSFHRHGIHHDIVQDSKVEFLQVDFAKKNFGLQPTDFSMLLSRVNRIIHNAWEVNWLAPLSAFERTHIKGVRSMIDFSVQSEHHPPIFFISSITTVYRWPDRHATTVPESSIDDCTTPLEIGYAQSKYVSEQILKIASYRCGLRCTVLRMGPIAGPTTAEGIWSPNDIIPGIIATSISLGKLPIFEGEAEKVNWVPLDTAGKIVSEIAAHQQRRADTETFAVFNIVNPCSVPWSTVASVIQEIYPVEMVSMDLWLSALQQVGRQTQSATQYPALKLIEPLRILLGSRRIPLMDIESKRAQTKSPTLDSLLPICRDDVLRWLKQWEFCPELVMYD
ncbi:male sterility protein-domain-containing protein [Aspergillus floccosus]